MEFQEDSSLATRLLQDLGEELFEAKPLPHLTELVYCLTRSFLNRFGPLPPTDSEVLLFMSGVGLERVLLKSHRQPHQGECEGIYYDVDFLDYDLRVAEFKSTRMSSKRPPEEFSEGWRRQVLGYLYCLREKDGAMEATLAVLFLMGNYAPPFPELRCWRAKASWDEIRKNWRWLQERKEVYLRHHAEARLPEPYKFCMDWECKNCRYSLLCEAWKAAQELGNATVS